MSNILSMTLAWAAGVGLGAFFFGGLWWTIRKGMASPRPALWFLGSALVRMAVALTGFYLVFGGQWQRLLICLVGFIMARLGVMWFTRNKHKEESHAP